MGQCSAKFKECIQTTAGCGEDFSNCVVITVNNSNSSRSAANAIKTHTIEGEVHSVTIFAATYDALAAKRPMCEHVTKQCVDVADQVWDTFLRDSAAQIKASETIAENNGRQNCVADISNCFQKACKDNIDPSDPDGSYDMCLSRPETMLNVCKVPLNNCGIDTTRKGTAQKSDIWQFIIARLASVRVNECTNQIKSCLAAEDRCGKDYTNCIGLDMDTIVGMCPLDKLTACDSSAYGGNRDEKLAYIYDVAQGVLLNVDNQLLQACQNAVNTKMMEICGGVSTCLFGDSNEGLGRGSLQTTQGDDGSYTISGTIDFNNFRFAHPENPATADYAATNKQKYAYKVSYGGKTGSGTTANRIDSVVADINSEVNRKISMLAMDPTINMCITGRNISQIVKGRNQEQRTAARFPNLLSSQANIIYDSLLTIARLNYTRDYEAELSNANSMSREYRNMMMCASMAELSGDFTPAAETRYGIIASDDWYVKLSGTSTKDQLDVLRSGASRTTPICTGARAADGKSCAGGESFMIATEERTAVYEPGPQVCRITSRLYACTGYEAIYEGESSSYNVDMGADVSLGAGVAGLEGEVGVGGNLGFGQSKSKTTHKENFCSSFAEPTVSEQIINFSSGEAIFGNVTRGNMQNSYYNSSSVSNVTDNSWSVDLALSVSDDHSQHSTTTVEGDNATINANQTMTDNSSLVKKYDEKGKEKCKKGQVEDGNGGCRAMTDEEKCKAKGEGFTWSNGTCEDTKKLENAKNKCLQQVLTKKWDGKNCVDKTDDEKAAAQALYEQNEDNCAKKGQKYRIGKSGGECYGKLSKEEMAQRNRESLGNAIASAENDLKSKLTQPDMAVLSTKVAQDASSNFMDQHKSSLEAMDNAAASGKSYEDYAKEEREKSLATGNSTNSQVASSEAATNSSSAGSGNSSSGSTGTSEGASSTPSSQADKRNPGELFDVPLGGACEIDGKKGIMTTVGCDISQTSQSKTNQNSNDAADTGLYLGTQKMVKAGAPCSEVGQLPHGVYTYVKGAGSLMHCVLTGCKGKKYKFVSNPDGIRNTCVPV